MKLEALQNALHQFISRRGSSQEEMQQLIRPSSHLGGDERARIYRRMYRLRMIEALEEDFPVCWIIIGEEEAGKLAMDYVARHPSRHFSLNGLGHSFAAFLSQSEKPWAPAVFDIARVEWGLVESFHAPDASTKGWQERLSDLDFWEKACLRLAPGTRLFALEHKVSAAFDSLDAEEPIELPLPEPQKIATFKYEDDAYRLVLSDGLHSLLEGLDGKTPLGTHIDRLLSDPRFQEQVRSVPEALQECIRMGCVEIA